MFGFEICVGWNSLVYNLLCGISILDKGKNLRIAQVKEKFGGLRFYFEWKGSFRKANLKNYIINSLHKLPRWIYRYIYKYVPSFDETEDYKSVSNLITLFEDISYKTCEKCGEPGILRGDLIWVLTLCNNCYSKVDPKRKRNYKLEKLAEEETQEKLLCSGHLQPGDIS
jgi:hypothetical protein